MYCNLMVSSAKIERGLLMESQDVEGERITILVRNIQASAADASALVEKALDQGVDAIVTGSSIVAQSAVNITMDMDDPPAVIFTRMTNPYLAGIAEAACIKPEHVTGMQTVVPYEEIMPLLLIQKPDLKKIGTIHSSSDADGIYGAGRIAEIATAMGLTVESAAIAGLADLRPAVQALVGHEVEAVIVPYDTVAGEGIPVIAQAALENDLLFFYSTPGGIYQGATIGGGAMLYYEEGAHAGLLLAAHLNGDIDLATTAIHHASNMFVGLNLDMAELQGMDIDARLLEQAVIVIENGALNLSGAGARQLRIAGRVVPLAERQADDMALLESLQCSDEMIAEQQAALDAASG